MKVRQLLSTLMVLSIFTINAQHHSKQHKHKPDFTPEQIATLKSKKMALQLDLTEAQIKSVNKLETEKAWDRKAMQESRSKVNSNEGSSEARFKRLDNQLDHHISYQRQMKKILTDKQYDLWKVTHHKNLKQRYRARTRHLSK
jgi:hypothetical protein